MREKDHRNLLIISAYEKFVQALEILENYDTKPIDYTQQVEEIKINLKNLDTNKFW